MRNFSKEELLMNQEDVHNKIRSGEIFIYPTDTIYGLGCNALRNHSVKKLRELKGRSDAPFSIIVPGKDWIHENCEVNDIAKVWINKLPGPYTLILKLNNNNAISELVNNSTGTIGVRIPNHWIQEISTILDIPIVTTSVNQTGKRFMTCMEDLDPEIKKGVNFVVYEDEIQGRASKIVNLTGISPEIRER